MRLKIDWASLIDGRKFTLFALFFFVFEGNFPIASPWGAYIWRGDLTEGFLRYRFGGAYTWLFQYDFFVQMSDHFAFCGNHETTETTLAQKSRKKNTEDA